MSTSFSNEKRIAKNTLALYVRMFINLIVSLYTSRVVLATLGINDYGIYGVVGSIVGFFSFLNAAQSGATSRFLTFQLGKGDTKCLKDTFSSAVIAHFLIALVVVILAETIGVWFLNHKLVIPEGRMSAARWVLQLSILSSVVTITQVPYNAAIIAHEKMDIYAYVEMLNVFLKLGIVYLVLVSHLDKLILYAALIFAISVFIAIVYRLYCHRHYEETHFNVVWDKSILKPLLSFSGYNLYGNMGNTFNLQGTNFLVNMFFGVCYNAAVGIATTVTGVVEGFASNVMTAFRPQVTKDYAQADYCSFERYLNLAVKVVLIMYGLVAIPAFVEIDKVLSLWLKEVPICAGVFCKLMLINVFFTTMRYILTMGIHATGTVKAISLWTGSLQLFNPFIVWLLFKAGMGAEVTYVSIIVINALLVCIDLCLLGRYIPSIDIMSLAVSFLLVFLVSGISLLVSYFLMHHFLEESLIRILISVVVCSALTITLAWLFCFNENQRTSLVETIKGKMNADG